MKSISQQLADITRDGNVWRTNIASNWMQGRTTYGGLSTVIAHHCARELLGPGAPPLRSGQIAFIGPLAGEIEIRCELLRQGRNTAFVSAQIFSSEGLGWQGIFIFMNSRDSSIAYTGLAAPDFGPPPGEGESRSGPPEFFTYNFDYPETRIQLGTDTDTLINWHRLQGGDTLEGMAELLTIGDVLPPAAMGLMTKTGPVSSMNWQINLLTDAPATDDGWWLVKSQTHFAANGASSQYMTVWNRALQPVMTGMQSVALFV